MKGRTLNEDLQVIRFNIFNLAPIIMSFYKECNVKQDSVLLSYLIIPLICSKKWDENLVSIQRRSNLVHWLRENKIPIEGLSERISFFKSYTTSALQYCFDMKWAYIDADNNIVLTDNKEWDKNQSFNMKTAQKINFLFKEMTVTQIYSSFGISKICLH